MNHHQTRHGAGNQGSIKTQGENKSLGNLLHKIDTIVLWLVLAVNTNYGKSHEDIRPYRQSLPTQYV